MPLRIFFFLLLVCPPGLQAQVHINELLASNATTNTDPDLGRYADWIELYNDAPVALDLSYWSLSDDADEPKKWVFPLGSSLSANGFMLLWADGENTGLHTNFKLSADGERVLLFDPQGNKVDEVKFVAQKTDVSLGRKSDGDGAWGYFTQPTPGLSNSGAVFYVNYVSTSPFVSLAGGFFNSPQTVEVKNLAPEAAIVRYTLDGSLPVEQSPAATQPLQISANTVLKARVFRDGQIPGPVVTNTYFIGENFAQRGLAVLSISGEPAHFWAQDSGLLTNHNTKPEWERPVHLEFYENDGILGFHHDAGASVGGENSWVLPQKLLNVFSRKQYGSDEIAYQIFPDIPRNRFEDLILRTSGNDWSNTYFRDAMQQSLAAQTADLDIQAVRPVACFVNGAYYGLYNIREKQDKEYLNIHRGIDADSLDYIENDAAVKEGDAQAYQQMNDLLNNGVSGNAAFSQLEAVMDTRNYTDYICSEIFCANYSWGHNIALYRARNASGKWRWLLHDYDRGFSDAGGTDMAFFTATNGASWSNPPFATLFLRKMLENMDYREKFITRFSDHLYISWNPATIRRSVNRHASRIRQEMPFHIARWQGTTSSYGNAIPSLAFWENEVQKLMDFGEQRNAHMWADLNNFFALGGYTRLRTDVSEKGQGRVMLHDMEIPDFPWTGQYFVNRPIVLTAIPNPGYKFLRWEKTMDSTAVLLPPNSEWRYYDKNTAPDADWKQSAFNDSNWSSGPAELGYGDNDEATLLAFGSDPASKTPSYYFRHTFQLSNASSYSSLVLRMVIDDGAVAYLNGKEIWRFNMGASQVIAFDALAASTTNDESGWHEVQIPSNLLVNGSNVLAVEVHQAALNSTDISFNAALLGLRSGQGAFLSSNPLLTYTLSGNPESLRAVFEGDGSCGVLPDTIFQDMTLSAACSPYRASGDVVLKNNARLKVEAGVEIWMPEKGNLWIEGILHIEGTENAPVVVKNAPGAGHWGAILLKNTPQAAVMRHLRLEHATSGLQRLYFPAAISAYKSDMELDHLDLTSVDDNPIFARFSAVKLTHSNIRTRVTGDGINVKQGSGQVEDCVFSGGYAVDMDAIDFDGVHGGIVRNNLIHDFRGDNNDGLDIGEQCKDLIIEGNFIYHCFDKGISVGQQSSASIRDNTIAYTAIGIALKDQSPVNIDHCTLFGNQYGIYAYEKNPGSLGGKGVVQSCIVSNAAFATYIADSLSSLLVSNSLSDPDALAGTDIINTDPMFVNPTAYDFNLNNGSPALGSGQGGTDMGALNLPAYKESAQLMVSEILYDDTLSSTGEFIELYNPGQDVIDLEGFSLVGSPGFTFPPGIKIEAGEYIVLAKDAAGFDGSTFQVFQWDSGKLANEGEKLLLFDRDGLLIDFVRYNNHEPWPEQSSLMGRSIELKGTSLDNHLASSWKSGPVGGSPGSATLESSVTHLSKDLGFHLYPNPASNYVYIQAEVPEGKAPQLRICDMLGRILIDKNLNQNTLQVDLSAWPAGVYQVSLRMPGEAWGVTLRFMH